MDVDTILLSLQERDNWRRRRDLLRGSLAEVRSRRSRLRVRLRRIKRELARLSDFSAEISARARTVAIATGAHATPQLQLTAR